MEPISIHRIFTKAIFATILVSLWGCEQQDPNLLTASSNKVEFAQEGGAIAITLQTDADSWRINNPASDWLVLSATSGTVKTANVTLTVATKTITPRTDTLVVTAGDAKPVPIIVTQASSDYLYIVTPDRTSLGFTKEGGTATVNITTDAPLWSLSSNADWLQPAVNGGSAGTSAITFTALAHTSSDARTATITLNAEYAPAVQITVSQSGTLYPVYNTSPLAPDATGMESNAVALAAKIKLGWNIGNTLEAIGGETAWGNPLISTNLIDLIKQSGFNAVRLPCSWNQYMANSQTAQLKTDWLNRVKEVVQYCVDRDMYVLLNIHWDGGWLENNCTADKQEANNAKQKAFWEQIATHLRDFDEHLLFAGTNEPNVKTAAQMAVLNTYHQTFVNAVRSTGGKNSYRVLVVQGPSTDIELTNQLMTTLPTDPIANRMMVEVHYYSPWNFCGLTKDESWGKMFYYWGNGYHSTTDNGRNATWGEEATVDANFKSMKTKFVDKGIPVIMGEYSVTRRSALTGDALTKHLASRAYYLKYVTRQAIANGIIPFYWDNGGTDNHGCGLFYRKTNSVFDQQALDAVIQGATNP